MQNPLSKDHHHLRVFNVGIVGASDAEFNVIKRIFTVTKYRSRCYEPKQLNKSDYQQAEHLDFIIMCSSNPNLADAWNKRVIVKEKKRSPLIFLVRPQANVKATYKLESPINPSKLVHLLDTYTIKELNFLPEFEIGQEKPHVEDMAVTGLKLLKPKGAVGKSSKNRHKVLIVDDSPSVRKQMELEFEILQSDLEMAEDAESAMKLIAEKTFDIIFLDVVMPGIDGYTACKQIKRSKLNKNTPVIMLTSKSSSFDKIKGTLSGCDAYLVKPVNHNEFTSVYNKHIEKVGK